jgi:hypothetical protein
MREPKWAGPTVATWRRAAAIFVVAVALNYP